MFKLTVIRSLILSFIALTWGQASECMNIGSRQITYADNGNILSMDGVGTMTYGFSLRPYHITALTPEANGLVPNRQQTVSYTCYNRPSVLTEGGRTATFTYNGDGERVKMAIVDSTGSVLTRYYIGSRYEFDQTPNGSKERLYLGGDAYSAPMVYCRENSGSWTAYNIGRDYLGSITQIASMDGTLIEEYGYDPWGRLRDPQTLEIYTPGTEPELFLGRGFTGHEHLTWFGLINMNARLYDPLLGRFLSPDPFVQAPDFTQNFNRYSYALNNPLKYTDKRGEFVFSTLIVAACIVAGVTIGAYQGYKIGESKGATGGELFCYTAGGAALGLIAGFTGSYVAMAVAPAVSAAGYAGFMGGVITGGLSGAAAGSVSGFGFEMLSSGSLNKAFRSGGLGLITGAATGALIGGTIEGIHAAIKGDNFFTGKSSLKGFNRDPRGALTKDPSINAQMDSELSIPLSSDYDLLPDPYGSNVTLYRGMTGSENAEGFLFMTNDPTYAATYSTGGRGIVQVTLPKLTLEQMYSNGDLMIYRGLHMIENDVTIGATSYTEFVFMPRVKPFIVRLFTPF